MKVSTIICGSALITLGGGYVASKVLDTIDYAKKENKNSKQKVRKIVSYGLGSVVGSVLAAEGVVMIVKGCRHL